MSEPHKIDLTITPKAFLLRCSCGWAHKTSRRNEDRAILANHQAIVAHANLHQRSS